MRSLKLGLAAIAASATLAAWSIVGCSASGSGDDTGGDTSGAQPDPGSSTLPPATPGSSGDDNSSGGSSGKPGKTDAGVDAGPPPPNPGDKCKKIDDQASRPCGACGTQTALCQADPDAGVDADGGPNALVWSDYGACTNELAGGCVPGTSETCGNCGTHTCSKYCAYGTCSGEPVGACKPGSLDYTSASCTAANTYKSRTCGTTCTYGSFSSTCAPPDNANKLTISGTKTGTAKAAFTWSAGDTIDGLDAFSTCPGADIATDGPYPYVAVELDNPTSQTATVYVWQSKAAGGSDMDGVMWIYANALPPNDDTTLQNCAYGVSEECDDGVCESFEWAGIGSVSIPPNGAVLVYNTPYFSSSTGAFELNVRTDNLK